MKARGDCSVDRLRSNGEPSDGESIEHQATYCQDVFRRLIENNPCAKPIVELSIRREVNHRRRRHNVDGRDTYLNMDSFREIRA